MNYINIDPFLPHCAPILLIDQWASISKKEVVTLFTIPTDCIFVANQFLQECGLIEHAAQTCSTIVGESFFTNYANPKDAKPVIGFISMIKKVCIHHLPKIHQTLRTEAQLLSRFDMEEHCLCAVQCQTYCEEVLILESVMNLFIREVG